MLIQWLNGLQYGLLLFLVASGLSLVFGTQRIINLAHGCFYMLGAYAVWYLTRFTGDFLVAIFIAIPLFIGIGMVVERYFFRWLVRRDPLQQVLFSYGLILVLDGLQSWVFGNDPHTVALPSWLKGSWEISADQEYPLYHLITSVVALILSILLFLGLRYSRWGMIIRAATQQREMVEALGIPTARLFSGVFTLGVVLASLSGMLAAPITSVYPHMGTPLLILSLMVVVMGGMGSMAGTFMAALMIGMVETFGKIWLSPWDGLLIYALMVLVMVARPEGISSWFSKNNLKKLLNSSVVHINVPRERLTWSLGCFYGAILTFPWWGAWVFPSGLDYYLLLIAKTFLLAILALSLHVLVGRLGLVSLGHGLYAGVGAYGVVRGLEVFPQTTWWMMLILAPLLSGFVAMVVGALVLRTRGAYFLMATLAFTQMGYYLVHNTPLGGSADGIYLLNPPQASNIIIYNVCGILLIITFLAMQAWLRSRWGLVYTGIRDNESRMRQLGYATTWIQWKVLVWSGSLAGLAGAGFALIDGVVTPDYFSWTESGNLLVMLILGGIGRLHGVIIGVFLFMGLREMTSYFSDHGLLMMGVIIIAWTWFFPHGCLGFSLRRTQHDA